MEEIVSEYQLTIGEEMDRDHKNDPFWRKKFILKLVERWEKLILRSGIRMDLHKMVSSALEDDLLMWPIGRMCFAHVNGVEEVDLDSDFSSKSILDPELLLKILRYFLSEPELSLFIKKEEGRRQCFPSWFDQKFSWCDMKGNEIRLSNFIVKFSEFCLSEFFERNHEEGYTATQLYIFTQLRHHENKECINVVPFSGMSAIQKKTYFDKWPNPDGFTYPDSARDRAVNSIRQHFEQQANRPAIPPITFNLN